MIIKKEGLFFYGTLRKNSRGFLYDVWERYANFVGNGYVQGKLYEIAGYPGAVLSDKASDRVYGEVYELFEPEILFENLDVYEEWSDNYSEPHEYKREQIEVFFQQS